MMNPFISVIVPIYNVEKYLHKCISSLLDQSYSHYEIILVEDGSPDRCGDICDEFKKKSDRITVLHLTNGGVSNARNQGMAVAKGDFFCFVDSDDWVENDYLKDFAENLDGDECIIIQSVMKELQNGSKINYLKYKNKKYIVDTSIREWLSSNYFHEGLPVNKIYSKKIITDHKLMFDTNIVLGEDEKWNLEYYRYIKSLVYIENCNYYYRYNPSSASNKSRPFHRELLRYQFRANYFLYVLKKYPSAGLTEIIHNRIEEFFRINIFDRIYSLPLSQKERISRLKKISNLPSQNLNLLKSKLPFRNIDYMLLKKSFIIEMDFFKRLRLKINQ